MTSEARHPVRDDPPYPSTQYRSQTRDIYAVRIKEHRGNETSAPCWPEGAYVRFRSDTPESFAPGCATYEACDKTLATFGTFREAMGIVSYMKRRYPFVVCEIRRFVEETDDV